MGPERRCIKLILLLLSALAVCSLQRPAADASSPQIAPKARPPANISKNGLRRLQMPTTSVGSLYLVPSDDGAGKTAVKNNIFLGDARGALTVRVPANKVVMLDLNARTIQDPGKLSEINPDGIDSLRIKASSMEDDEISPCRKVLRLLGHFKNLRYLDLDKSQIIDSDIKDVKLLTKLTALTVYLTAVNGSFLKDMAGLKEINFLDLDSCPLKADNLRYLNGFPQLSHLNLNCTNLEEAGAKNLAGCTSVTLLQARNNPKLDDRSLKYLLAMKKLIYLDLRYTAVTPAGIEQLKALPLYVVMLAGKSYPSAAVAHLQRALPKAKIVIEAERPVSKEDQVLFAPTH